MSAGKVIYRVVLEVDLGATAPERFTAAWRRMAEAAAAAPGNLSQSLNAAEADPARYFICSEWASEHDFRAFSAGSSHADLARELKSLGRTVSMTRMHHIAAGPVVTTRPQLYRMMRLYKETALLRAAVAVGVFDAIASGATTAEAIATSIDADPRGTRLLLNALAAIELVQFTDGHFTLDDGARELLTSSSSGFYGGMTAVVASDEEWDALRDLAQAVRHGGSVREVDAETPGFSYWETFARAAGPVTTPAASLLADTLLPWATAIPAPRILDLACGHGAYGFTLAERLPEATVTGVDWPNVLEVTRKHASDRGLAARTRFVPGDMFEVDLEPGQDVVLVTNVLHHFSERRATDLLRRAARCLAPAGRLAIVGFVAGEEPATDPEPHLFAILMLVWTSGGEAHSVAGHERMCAGAGLRIETSERVPGLPFHVTVARRAE